MSIACGVCGGRHESVQEVRECSSNNQGGMTDIEAEVAAIERTYPPMEALIEYRDVLIPADPWEGATEGEPGDWTPGPAHYLAQRRNPNEFAPEELAPKNETPAPVKLDVREDPGYFKASDGNIYQTVRSKTGRMYAKVLTEDGKWEYAQGWVFKLKEKWRMNLDDVKRWGRKTGRCMVCGRELTNPDSIANGIGPICANGF